MLGVYGGVQLTLQKDLKKIRTYPELLSLIISVSRYTGYILFVVIKLLYR